MRQYERDTTLERDPELLERLEGCAQEPLEGTVYRVVWADSSPIQGSSVSSGRWSSPDRDFEVLNTSFVNEGAKAEFEAFWTLFEHRPDRRALTWKVRVKLSRVVELDAAQLDELGVGQAEYKDRDYSRTQEISDALNYLGCEGLIVPSARYDCKNLIVYMQNLNKDCIVEEDESIAFSWS